MSSKSWDSNHNHVSRDIMENYEHSYLHVVKPHLNFTDPERIPEKHYPFARQKFLDMIKLGVLEHDPAPCLYLYQITDLKFGFVYTGITGLAAADDYLNGNIKVHEHTLSKKEEALVKHVEYVKAVGEPVLLTFEGGSWYDDLVNKVEAEEPMFSFTGDELVKTEVWPIRDQNLIASFQQHMEALPAFYIADGHHRSAGAVRYCKKMRAEHPDYTGEEAFNYFLAYFIPTNKLKIFEFNRLVKNLGSLNEDGFLSALKQHFVVEEIGHSKLKVRKKNHLFGMYMDGIWYGLDLKEPAHGNVLDKLDVAILENYILKDILHIHDSKTDDRLSFVDGTKGISRLQELVDIGEYKVAFSLFPTKVEEVIEVADEGLVMPPKSTWFEPKLRTGLLIYEMD
ncbi:MAG: DUF1015 family protein [Bacteroidota bacterium]|nr:DUF1015 family protein [Bacteroidota bacterium]MDX5431677.1 DUF1015 family protein [Bacteroidota bacterium]MDX5470392.1 DUF1015 family protein [Bacteroidota bacterium]